MFQLGTVDVEKMDRLANVEVGSWHPLKFYDSIYGCFQKWVENPPKMDGL